jgi:hypothetical protein
VQRINLLYYLNLTYRFPWTLTGESRADFPILLLWHSNVEC